MNEDTVKKLALIIAANCTKDSALDASLESGKLSEQQFKHFNKQMSDRLYTFLTYLLNKPADEYSVMMGELSKNYPDSWSMPDLDHSFISIANQSSSSQLPPTSSA